FQPDEIRCTHLVLTHGHADHLGDALPIAMRTGAPLFAAFEICNYFNEKGHPHTEPMNPGGQVSTDFGFVALTQALHSSSYEGRYMGMPCGAVIEIDGVTLYHAGDTALFGDMRLIGELYQPDVAILPIGDRFTMGPEHATKAAELVGAKVAIPCHYNTWPPIEIDVSRFNPDGIEVKAIDPGASINLP
ncbi:MAG: metal-dependent hydrolase, partial [Planctomycetota bacterium]